MTDVRDVVASQELCRELWEKLDGVSPAIGSTALTLLVANFLSNNFGIRNTGIHSKWLAQFGVSVLRAIANYQQPDKPQ